MKNISSKVVAGIIGLMVSFNSYGQEKSEKVPNYEFWPTEPGKEIFSDSLFGEPFETDNFYVSYFEDVSLPYLKRKNKNSRCNVMYIEDEEADRIFIDERNKTNINPDDPFNESFVKDKIELIVVYFKKTNDQEMYERSEEKNRCAHEILVFESSDSGYNNLRRLIQIQKYSEKNIEDFLYMGKKIFPIKP